MSSISSKESIYLIGDQNEKIDGCKLPTNRQVLSVFFYNHTTLNLTIRQSANNAIESAQHFWSLANIPVIQSKHSFTKLERLRVEWRNIHKTRFRNNSAAQTLRVQKYVNRLDQLFDISNSASEATLCDSQQRFLLDQRSMRESIIPREDETEITDTSMEHDADAQIFENNPSQAHTDCSELSYSLSQLSTDSTVKSSKRSVSDFEDGMSSDTKEPQSKKMNIITPDLAAALDRTKTSSRNATYILAATATSLGFDINYINLSASAIHRQRIKFREEAAREIKEKFKTSDLVSKYWVVHWDGKLLPEIIGSGTVERLPIIISGVGTEQLLGVPKLPSGTGANQATAIIKVLADWEISHRVKAMCFDTTSTNTGRINGACTLLEKKLNRNLLYLACRHHVYELLLRSVVEIYWPTTTGPNVPVFKRFQSHWANIDPEKYETGVEDEYIAQTLSTRKEEILGFILDQITVSQPRDDYREFLELSYIFLGGEPPRGVKFKTPGAMHHARWLSKALYCLKMFLFRKQFALNARESNGLKHICIFIILFYVESWFNAPVAIKAPNYDLKLMQRLNEHRNINPDVSKAALSKLAGHLWYLSDELAPLSLFDDSVSVNVKCKMVKAIQERESLGRNVRPMIKERNFEVQDISDFITKNSLFLFKQFDLKYDFLQKAPELWDADETFQTCRSVFKQLKVVNDIAERGVALIEKYNDSLTKDEEQKQFLLQVVKKHRQQYPNSNKKTLCR